MIEKRRKTFGKKGGAHVPELTVKMFGTPAIVLDGEGVVLPYRKAEALLYYLVMEGRAPRRELVELLWEDTDSSTALKNLRHAAYTVRKVLGMDLFLPGQRTVLELNPEIPIACDVLDFRKSGTLEHYQGEFLSGFALPGNNAFEEWLNSQRSTLRTQYLKGLLAAEREAFAAGELDRAEKLGLEYIARDPLEESAYVVLMELYSREKKFRKAIGIYHQLCKSLENELSISPLKETTALYYRIVDEWNSSTYRIEEQSDHPIFGKEAALRSLLSVCSRPLSDRGCPCILLEGAAGVGKTYLLDHVLGHYDFSDRLVLRTNCYQSEAGVPLAPWNSIMLSLLSELEARGLAVPDTYLKTAADLFPGLSRRWGEGYTAPDEQYPLQHNYHVAQESALLILAMAARQIPLLLVFEDIHWIDRTSAELLSAFLRRLHNLNVTVICSSREPTQGFLKEFVEKGRRDKILERYPISAFSREETRRFVCHYRGKELTESQLNQIYQGTGGNALLLSQLMESLQDGDDKLDIEQMLKGIISYRLSQLSVEELQVLDIIAIFSDWASMDALSSILTKDTVDLMYLCSQLKQRQLIVESARNGVIGYALAHDLIRHVLSLSAFTGLCFDLLPTLSAAPESAQPDADSLPHYFHTLEQELASLRQLYADQQELDELEMILLHAKSRYCIYNGLYEPGLAALEQLTALCQATGENQLLVQVHLQYIYYGIQIYDVAMMEEHLKAGKALLEGQERSESYGIYQRLEGLLEQMQGNYQEARDLLYRSIHTLESLVPSSNDRYAINIAGAYNYIAECCRLEGRYEEAFGYYDKAIIHNRSRGYYPGAAVFYTNYGVCAFQKGEYEAAYQLFLYAVEIYQSSHEYSGYPLALGYLALYEVKRGEFAQAEGRLKEAHRISDVIGSPWWKGIVIYLSWRIRSYLDQTGQVVPQLRALWPASEREHCQWGLSYLERISPRKETGELRRRLEELDAV